MLGDLARAPPGVQAASARLMRSSAALAASAPPGAPRRVVNVCFSYTSTEELAAAVGRLRGAVGGGALLAGDVTRDLLRDAMHTGAPALGGSPPVDLVLRTSGEERLSDFLLWQSGGALLTWLPVLWPQLGYLDLLRALRAWQAARPTLAALDQAAGAPRGQCQQHRHQQQAVVDSNGGGCNGGSSCSGACPVPCAAAAAAVDRPGAAALAAVGEELPGCAPHPSQQLRVDDFLRSVEMRRQEWIRGTLDGEAAAVA